MEITSIKERTYYSIQHIQSAAIFARLSHDIEKAYDGKFVNEVSTEHNSYVTASIFSTVAFLEATINELFVDAVDNPRSSVHQLGPDVVKRMTNMWKLQVPKTASFRIPDKYNIALILAGKEPLDAGVSPYQDVALVIKLRNALIHYEPEWITTFSTLETEQAITQEFEKHLRGKFPLNPMAGVGNAFFPDKCLGHGCAKWAVVSGIQFVDEFFAQMSMIPTFDHVRLHLNTE
jgi:hypothetical protein